MLATLATLLLAGLVALYVNFWLKTRYKMKMTANIPGPKPLPLLGNALEFGFNSEYMYENVLQIMRRYGNMTRVWMGHNLVIFLAEPKYMEIVFNSNTLIDKNFVYDYIHPWLGDGLLTSTGQKWKEHRKLFTPTFHFKILEQFVEVFNSNDKILIEVLEKNCTDAGVDICPYITRCTLDIICETAMGVSVNAQRDTSSGYVHAVRNMGEVMLHRTFNPLLQVEFLFQLSPMGRLQSKSLKILHGMTNAVIQTRKKQYLNKKQDDQQDTADIGIKKRLAFLDLLLQAQQDGVTLTDEQIREEVDTFMFEGHDTTTSGITFALWCLAKYQLVQEKAVEELKEIFGDSDRDSSFSDLQKMKYLELVIKETQRLYPSVPWFGRNLRHDLRLGDYVIPAGSNVTFIPHVAHRHPEHFHDPDKFDPDRFLPDNSKDRHPFAFVPFSAGPRNCIGQKFAILEMKATISAMLRHFKLSLRDPNEEMSVIGEFVSKPRGGVRLQLDRRNI